MQFQLKQLPTWFPLISRAATNHPVRLWLLLPIPVLKVKNSCKTEISQTYVLPCSGHVSKLLKHPIALLFSATTLCSAVPMSICCQNGMLIVVSRPYKHLNLSALSPGGAFFPTSLLLSGTKMDFLVLENFPTKTGVLQR